MINELLKRLLKNEAEKTFKKELTSNWRSDMI